MFGVKMKTEVVDHTTGLQASTGRTEFQLAAEYLYRSGRPCGEGTQVEKGKGRARSAASSCSNNKAA